MIIFPVKVRLNSKITHINASVPTNIIPGFVIISDISICEGCCSIWYVVRVEMAEVRHNNYLFNSQVVLNSS